MKLIIGSYKVIFDYIKNILSYIVIITAVTIIFGYLRMIGFLLGIDNSWLINFIDYKTLLNWGISSSIIFIIAFFAVLDDHLNFEKNFQHRMRKIIYITYIFYFIIIITLYYFLDIAFPNLNMTFLAMASVLFFLDLSTLVDALPDNTFDYLKNIIWIATMPLFLLWIIFSNGLSEGFSLKKGNFENIAHIDNEKYGVLLNNNNTVFLIDLHLSKKIKIVKIDDISYFTKKENNNTNLSREHNKTK